MNDRVNQENDGKKYVRVGQSRHPIITTDIELFKRSRISSTFSEKFAVISSAVKIVSSSAISSSVETVCRDFLLLGEEAESSELADILFLLFPNSSVINSAICRYGDLGYFKKLRTATISVFTPPLLVPVQSTAICFLA